MSDDSQDIQVDPLFVGLTRPATIGGIPYFAAVLEFLATVLVFLAVGNPLYLVLAAPLHGVLYLISASDPWAFDTIAAWVKTTGRCLNARFWGATSFSPLPTKKWLE
jgi:type IV secretion system protein VirB3